MKPHEAFATAGDSHWPFDSCKGRTRDKALANLIASLDPFQGEHPFRCDTCNRMVPEAYGADDDCPDTCNACMPNA